MSESPAAITLQRHGDPPALALYRRHGVEVEGHLRDYALRDGVFTDACSMARLRRREG